MLETELRRAALIAEVAKLEAEVKFQESVIALRRREAETAEARVRGIENGHSEKIRERELKLAQLETAIASAERRLQELAMVTQQALSMIGGALNGGNVPQSP